MPSRHSKMQRRLQPAASSPRRKNCLRFSPSTHCKTHRPTKNWSETLLAPTRAASTSSIDWFTRYSLKKGLSVYCVCGLTMSERANRSAHADWHNAAVADEAAVRFQLPLCPAWISVRSVATSASVIAVGFHYACKAPNGQGILAKPQVQDSDPNNTGLSIMQHRNPAGASWNVRRKLPNRWQKITIENYHLSSIDCKHRQRSHSPASLLGRPAWKFQDRRLAILR